MGRGLGGSHHQQLGPGEGSQWSGVGRQLGPEEGSQWSVVDRPLGPAGEGTLWLGEGRPHLLEEVAGGRGRAVGDRAAAGVDTAALGKEVGFP